MLARYCEADIIVIGLVGERGREVKEFIENDLGPEGYRKSVVVCATSDMPPLVRLKGHMWQPLLPSITEIKGRKLC